MTLGQMSFSSGQLFMFAVERENSCHFLGKLSEQFELFSSIKLHNMSTQKQL